MRQVGRAYLVWGIVGIAVLIAGVAWATRAALAQPASAIGSGPAGVTSLPDSNLAGASAMGVAGSSAAASYPAWCCSGGSPVGLTVTGQATARGSGSAARTSAIARAISDAARQAKDAASAAGISLGKIVNMQVSAPYYPYPYPVPMGVAAGGAGGTTGISGAPAASGASGPAGSASAIPCRAGTPCPGYPGVGISATVTITWAIA